MMAKLGKALAKVLMKLVIAALVFFVVTFTMYFFNLDMKATALVEPWFKNHYDNLDRKQYI